jgi:xylan 1,4-beta-xylosidase
VHVTIPRSATTVRYCVWLVLTAAAVRGFAKEEPFPVVIQVDAARSSGDLKPIWRFFGADEPNYGTMTDGRKLLGELGRLGKPQVYFRAHNLLTSGDGTPALKWGSTGAYGEDGRGRPVYDWSIVDHIFDTYRTCDLRPYVEIGFMPEALSIHPFPYQHHWQPVGKSELFTGWAYPPKDYTKWAELVRQWVNHCVEKYGRPEVEQWYWETWNEANIGYWQGRPEEFYKLHDYTLDAVRRALPTARVGGPDCAGYGGEWTRHFLDHCLRGTNYATGKVGTPLDFVSFHAKGAPVFTNGFVRMGMATQLREIDRGFGLIASYPELKNTPIVIGESDPEGCAACQGAQLGYRNGTMYSSYTAAIFARKPELAAKHGVNLEGALTWAFEFEDQPFFAGFRAVASRGIDLPVLNVFRMFGKMEGQSVVVSSSGTIPLETLLSEGARNTPDVSAVAGLAAGQLAILVWHYHDDDLPGPDAAVELAVIGLPVKNGDVRLLHYRIDDRHSNAYAEWKRMGSPVQPDREQYDRLIQAGELARLENAPAQIPVRNGSTTLKFQLPRQAVSLVVLELNGKGM